VLDGNFTILEAAREGAGGYSFPSGHTQTAVGTFGSVVVFARKKWIAIACVVLAALVGFSRMYIGVHTPADVLAGALLSIVLIALFYPWMLGETDRTYFGLISLAVLSVIYLLYMELTAFPADIDPHNYESAMKNAYTLIGCSAALLIVYPVEKRYINYSEKAVWWAQILKITLGLLVVLAVKEGLRSPLELLLGGHLAARAVRYFLIVITAGLIWPLSFQFFAKIGNKK
jgi:membrane-associated phospholipid phosphatase